MEPLRTADGIGGLIVFLVIGFILNLLSKAQQKQRQQPQRRPPAPGGAAGSEEGEEGLSLQKILREIERVKREAEVGAQPQPTRQPTRPTPSPQPRFKPAPRPQAQPKVGRMQSAAQADRGPMGRHSAARLPGAEEVEVREVLGGRSLEVERRHETLEEVPVVVDLDEESAAAVRRRLAEAEARNRPHMDADHKAFDQRRVEAQAKAQAASTPAQVTGAQLRNAVVWREVLGPPRAFDEL